MGEGPPQGVVYSRLERTAAATSLGLELVRDVFIQGEGGADALML